MNLVAFTLAVFDQLCSVVKHQLQTVETQPLSFGQAFSSAGGTAGGYCNGNGNAQGYVAGGGFAAVGTLISEPTADNMAGLEKNLPEIYKLIEPYVTENQGARSMIPRLPF